ncbi:MAG: hypothetical protein FJ271_12940 [Planctomycetes bacterium]|nr:hypothetical protein [Planctomycetota bacterium]
MTDPPWDSTSFALSGVSFFWPWFFLAGLAGLAVDREAELSKTTVVKVDVELVIERALAGQQLAFNLPGPDGEFYEVRVLQTEAAVAASARVPAQDADRFVRSILVTVDND